MRFIFWQGGSGLRRIYVRGHGLPTVIFLDEGGFHVVRRWGRVTESDLVLIGKEVADFVGRFGGVREAMAVLAWRREERLARAAFEAWVNARLRLARLVTARTLLHLVFFVRLCVSKKLCITGP